MDDPVRNLVEYTVTDDGHSMIEAVEIGQAGGITEHFTSTMNVNN